MARPIITLTTDFGQADAYVAAMKGVILGICPEATLVDVCHEVRPQNVRQAAHLFATVAPYFPSGPGIVHLVIVDPGVGSARRPILVRTGRATYVAPDNGVLSLALAEDPAHLAVHLTNPRYRRPKVSSTFHGRDIFAPVAAYLAGGMNPLDMGPQIDPSGLVTVSIPQPSLLPDGWLSGEVIHVDRFGNLVTSLRSQEPDSPVILQVGTEQIIGVSRTFADVEPGGLLAYVGSSAQLEIAVRGGNAAAHLNVEIGSAVRVRPAGPLGP